MSTGRPHKKSKSGHGDAGGGAAAGAGTRGRGGRAAPAGGECEYKRRCREFLASLQLDPVYFNAEHDRCYCPACAAAVSMPDNLRRFEGGVTGRSVSALAEGAASACACLRVDSDCFDATKCASVSTLDDRLLGLQRHPWILVAW